METEKRECPHCHGSLERYEDPVAVKMLQDLHTKDSVRTKEHNILVQENRALTNEVQALRKQSSENCLEWQDWERWAKEVLTDFKIPYDNHKVGMRMAITQWMADKLHAPAEPANGEIRDSRRARP